MPISRKKGKQFQLEGVQVFLSCSVSTGMFSSERAISVELVNGRTVTAFVDSSDVRVDHDPQPGEVISGQVRVVLVEEKDGSAFIDLPQSTISNGPRIEVSTPMLEALSA